MIRRLLSAEKRQGVKNNGLESNDSPEIPDRRETSDIPGFPSRLV